MQHVKLFHQNGCIAGNACPAVSLTLRAVVVMLPFLKEN